MARADDYDSASSQFFIVQEDCSADLDMSYAVFGYVVNGISIVDDICGSAEPTDDNGTIEKEDQPIITTITIYTPEEYKVYREAEIEEESIPTIDAKTEN